jgi:hypothetical protein
MKVKGMRLCSLLTECVTDDRRISAKALIVTSALTEIDEPRLAEVGADKIFGRAAGEPSVLSK